MKKMLLSKDSAMLLIIALILIGFEFLFRIVHPWMSGDIRQIEAIPKKFCEIEETDTNTTTILFIGNSLVGEAIDTKLIESYLGKNRGKKYRIEKIAPDGTDLPDWYFILKNNMVNRKSVPDYVIIGFAWNGALQDQNELNHVRLGGAYCKLNNLHELSEMGLHGIEKYGDFIFSKISKVFAFRETIRNRTLDIAIPYYRECARVLNDSERDSQIARKVEKPPIEATYSNLGRLIRELESKSSKTVFVAMPLPEKYTIKPELVQMIKKNASFVDMREFQSIDNKMFVDRMHLGKTGQKNFTQDLITGVIEKITSE